MNHTRKIIDTEVIDSIDDADKPVLFSKLSVALIGLIISPFFALIIYCANLRYSGQKEKIFGTLTTVVISYSLVLVSSFGFEHPFHLVNLYSIFTNLIITCLMIFPFWNIHFGELEFKTTFPYFRVIFIIVIYSSIVYYNYFLSTHFNYRNPAPWYTPHIGTVMIVFLTVFLVFAKFIFKTIRKTLNLLFPKLTNHG